MSTPLPDALHVRFQRYIKEGLSGRAAALRLKLSLTTGARWALAIKGCADAAPQGRPRGRGVTMPELDAVLFDATGVRAHPIALGKFLRKLGYTYKKSLVATERRRAKVRRQHETGSRIVYQPW